MLELGDDTHVSAVSFEAPIEAVWPLLIDPLRFPELYPSWIEDVVAAPDGSYVATGPSGDQFENRPVLDRDHGIIDFAVIDESGNMELSRSRLLATGEAACVLIHLAVRWPRLDDQAWDEHKRSTDSDLVRAKQIIEAGTRCGGSIWLQAPPRRRAPRDDS